jgi:hypothetical protein
MSINTIIDRIIEDLVIAGVPSRCIHDGERDFYDPAGMMYAGDDPTSRRRQLVFVDSTGWEPASPDGANEFGDVYCDGLEVRYHQILVRCWYEKADPQTGNSATGKRAFRTMLEAVAAQMKRDPTLMVRYGSGAYKYTTPAAQNLTMPAFVLDEEDVPGAQGSDPIPAFYAEITFKALERILG